LIEALRQGHQELGRLYKLLLEGKTAAREQIIGALLVKAQDIRAKSEQLADIQHQQVMKFQRHADIIVMVAIAALAGLSMILLTLMSRRLTRGIGQLDDGMRRVAAGDLAHQIQLATADELGALAHSFNSMSQRLRNSYDALKDEISKRQEAETEIHQLNAELEERVHGRTAELQAANQELEAFAYSVSHDLRAPLRAIDGFSRKVVMGYGGRLDDEGRRQLQVVRDNAQHMGTLIDDLLAFSRMGRREMAWQPLDMDAMVKGVADELRAAEPRRAIEFAFSPLPRAWGDAAMLRQVWVNLLANAVKFSRQRPVAHIEIGGCAEGGEVQYWVKDDGAGFDMWYSDKLFGVFQRLHRQEEFEGTGVGLAIVQRILHRHKGRIWGEGKPDAGATFRFALPVPSVDDHFSGGPAA
jgi:light-regulated signal transduction histidine kinase (bacteriophytochrome)